MKVESEKQFDFAAVKEIVDTIDEYTGKLKKAENELEVIKELKELAENGCKIEFYINGVEENSNVKVRVGFGGPYGAMALGTIEDCYSHILDDFEQTIKRGNRKLISAVAGEDVPGDQESGSVVIVHVND